MSEQQSNEFEEGPKHIPSLIDRLHDRVIDLQQEASELRMAVQKLRQAQHDLEQLQMVARLALEVPS